MKMPFLAFAIALLMTGTAMAQAAPEAIPDNVIGPAMIATLANQLSHANARLAQLEGRLQAMQPDGKIGPKADLTKAPPAPPAPITDQGGNARPAGSPSTPKMPDIAVPPSVP